MKYLLPNNRAAFNATYKAGLSSSIYIPLNAGRYVGPENNNSLFKNKPDTDSVNLADWITNQITLGNISTGTDANGIISALPAGDVTIDSAGNILTLNNTVTNIFTEYDINFSRTKLTLDSDIARFQYERPSNQTTAGFVLDEYTIYMFSDDGPNTARVSITGPQITFEGDSGGPFSYKFPQGNPPAVGNEHGILTWNGVGGSVNFLAITQPSTSPAGYADDAAAGVGGVGIGYLYYNTTNNVFKVRMT